MAHDTHPHEAHHDGSADHAHSHMHDHDYHVRAVEADLEYWRTKRLEPRLIQLHRRGVVTFYDLVRAAPQVPKVPAPVHAPAHDIHDIEHRIRALEDGMDDYIRGIGLAWTDPKDYPFVIEDTRKERGDYDDFFRIAKPPHEIMIDIARPVGCAFAPEPVEEVHVRLAAISSCRGSKALPAPRP